MMFEREYVGDFMHAFYFITWVILYVYTCICFIRKIKLLAEHNWYDLPAKFHSHIIIFVYVTSSHDLSRSFVPFHGHGLTRGSELRHSLDTRNTL